MSDQAQDFLSEPMATDTSASQKWTRQDVLRALPEFPNRDTLLGQLRCDTASGFTGCTGNERESSYIA